MTYDRNTALIPRTEPSSRRPGVSVDVSDLRVHAVDPDFDRDQMNAAEIGYMSGHETWVSEGAQGTPKHAKHT